MSSRSPAVSVLLCARGEVPGLVRAVRSCLDGTFSDLELVLVDDGIGERSIAEVEAIADGETRLRIVAHPGPPGIAGATAFGWPHCRGDLIARMDADDISYPERLEKQVAMMRSDDSLAGVSCLVAAPNAGPGMSKFVDWCNDLTMPEDIAAGRFVETPLIQPSLLLKRSAVEEVGGYIDPGWAEDYDLWMRMLDAGMRFQKVPELLLDWPDSAGRLTRTDPRYSHENFLRAKAHYLGRIPLARASGVAVCGAGPIGKKLSKFLREAEGIDVRCFYEVNPRQIGERIGGVEVRAADQLSSDAMAARRPLLVNAVGVEGGRKRVRGLSEAAGYKEGSDFFSAA